MPATALNPENAIEETATDRWTGCWYGCGVRIERGDQRVRLRQYLFHPDCFNLWLKKRRAGGS